MKINERIAPDITILVRMDEANQRVTDYYLLPIMDIETPKLLFCETNGSYLDTYQFANLERVKPGTAGETGDRRRIAC